MKEQNNPRVSLQNINYAKIILDKLAEIKEVFVVPVTVTAEENNRQWTAITIKAFIMPSDLKAKNQEGKEVQNEKDVMG